MMSPASFSTSATIEECRPTEDVGLGLADGLTAVIVRESHA